MNRRVEHNCSFEELGKAIEEAVEDYYTSLSPEERAELAAWGDFALTEFPEDL